MYIAKYCSNRYIVYRYIDNNIIRYNYCCSSNVHVCTCTCTVYKYKDSIYCVVYKYMYKDVCSACSSVE